MFNNQENENRTENSLINNSFKAGIEKDKLESEKNNKINKIFKIIGLTILFVAILLNIISFFVPDYVVLVQISLALYTAFLLCYFIKYLIQKGWKADK